MHMGSMYRSINSCLVTKACHIQNGGMYQKKTSHDTVDSYQSSDDTESSMPHLVVSFFAITIDALTQLAVFTRAQ